MRYETLSSRKKKRQKIFYWHTSACNSLSHIASAWPARLLYTGMHEIILPRCRVWSIQQRVCATRPSHRKKQMQGCLKRSHKRLWKQMGKQSQLIITSTKYSMQLSKLEKALILLHGAANMSDAKCCWFYNKNTWTQYAGFCQEPVVCELTLCSHKQQEIGVCNASPIRSSLIARPRWWCAQLSFSNKLTGNSVWSALSRAHIPALSNVFTISVLVTLGWYSETARDWAHLESIAYKWKNLHEYTILTC